MNKTLTILLLSLTASVARADVMVFPPCTCNDDCKAKWPYTRICEATWGGTYCGYSGPGIPCKDGGPQPARDVAAVTCTCNDDCKAGWPGPFCDGTHCSMTGYPGIPCKDGRVPAPERRKDGGVPFPPDARWTAEWDHPHLPDSRPTGYVDDVWWTRDMGGPRSDGDPNALAPRSGCSCSLGGSSGGAAGASALAVALLLGMVTLALALARRLRRRQ